MKDWVGECFWATTKLAVQQRGLRRVSLLVVLDGASSQAILFFMLDLEGPFWCQVMGISYRLVKFSAAA